MRKYLLTALLWLITAPALATSYTISDFSVTSGADRLCGWDESATDSGCFSLGTGIDSSGTTINVTLGDFDTDDLVEGTTNLYFTNERAQDGVGATLTDTATIDFTYNDAGNATTADVKTNSISNSLFRQSAGLSLVGRAANTTGDVADITAASDNQIFRRSGTSIGFGSIDLSQSNAVGSSRLAYGNIAQIATDRLIGRDTAGTGDQEALTVGGGVEFTGSGGIQTSAFTGDATKTAGGTSLTLATVNSNVGGFGSGSQVATFTVNGKGLITAAANTNIAIASTAVTDFTEAAQDATGAMVNSTLTYTDGTPLLSVNEANNFAWTGANTQTSGSYRFNDNIKALFGDSSDAEIYYDATNLIIQPTAVGSGVVSIGPTGSYTSSTGGAQTGATENLLIERIGLGGSPINNFYWINYDLETTAGRGALGFFQNYTGVGGLQLGVTSKVTYSGSSASPNNVGLFGWSILKVDNSGTSTSSALRAYTDIDSSLAFTQGTHILANVDIASTAVGGTHTGGTIYRYGIRQQAFPAITCSGAACTDWGAFYGNDLAIGTDVKYYDEGTMTAKGDSYITFNSASTDRDFYIDNTKVMTQDNDNVDTWVSSTVNQSTLGNLIQRLISTASNDDVAEDVYQNKVTTTDATTTTLHTVAIPATTTVVVEARIAARRTGGSSGTAEDGAGYMVYCTYKNVAGTATEIGETVTITHESQAAWNATCTPSSGNALIQITGAANNNVSWVGTVRSYAVGQ